MTSNEPSPRRAVLAGHGDFAAGLASAVAQISGRADVFVLLSNRGKSGEEIERTLREALDADALHVVFTDLPAGSCTFSRRSAFSISATVSCRPASACRSIQMRMA